MLELWKYTALSVFYLCFLHFKLQKELGFRLEMKNWFISNSKIKTKWNKTKPHVK